MGTCSPSALTSEFEGKFSQGETEAQEKAAPALVTTPAKHLAPRASPLGGPPPQFPVDSNSPASPSLAFPIQPLTTQVLLAALFLLHELSLRLSVL